MRLATPRVAWEVYADSARDRDEGMKAFFDLFGLSQIVDGPIIQAALKASASAYSLGEVIEELEDQGGDDIEECVADAVSSTIIANEKLKREIEELKKSAGFKLENGKLMLEDLLVCEIEQRESGKFWVTNPRWAGRVCASLTQAIADGIVYAVKEISEKIAEQHEKAQRAASESNY